jgi:uncharacterized protein (DUF2141 family)
MATHSRLIAIGCALLLASWLSSPGAPVAQAAPAGSATAEAAGTLVVQLWHFKNDRGQALLALFRSKQGFPDEVRHATWSKALPIRNRRVDITIERVPAGTIALAMVHDEDKDFALDTGLFGIPTEGYGASRDAPANFGPPKWEDAAFSLRAGERKSIRIRVRY